MHSMTQRKEVEHFEAHPELVHPELAEGSKDELDLGRAAEPLKGEVSKTREIKEP